MAPPLVDTVEFRRVVGRFATGVTVVTARGEGEDHAITVNSFTSVSLEPLLVLISIEKAAFFHEVILRAGEWGVSVLAADQEPASRWFSTRGRDHAGELAGYRLRAGAATGVSLLEGAVATMECRTHAAYDGGDHTLLLGDVLSLAAPAGPVVPLLYAEGRYLSLPTDGGRPVTRRRPPGPATP